MGSWAAGSGHRGSRSARPVPEEEAACPRTRDETQRVPAAESENAAARPARRLCRGPRARSHRRYPGLISCRSRPTSRDTAHFQLHPTGKIWKHLAGGSLTFFVPSLWPEQGFVGATVSSVSPSRAGDAVKTDPRFLRQIKVRKGKTETR